MDGKFPRLLFALLVLVLIYPSLTGAQNARAGAVPAIKKDCSVCHLDIAQGPALNKPISTLCVDCHPDRTGPGEHRVGVMVRYPVDALPLQDGAMSCVTCHDPHGNGNARMLRLPAQVICGRCHRY